MKKKDLKLLFSTKCINPPTHIFFNEKKAHITLIFDELIQQDSDWIDNNMRNYIPIYYLVGICEGSLI